MPTSCRRDQGVAGTAPRRLRRHARGARRSAGRRRLTWQASGVYRSSSMPGTGPHATPPGAPLVRAAGVARRPAASAPSPMPRGSWTGGCPDRTPIARPCASGGGCRLWPCLRIWARHGPDGSLVKVALLRSPCHRVREGAADSCSRRCSRSRLVGCSRRSRDRSVSNSCATVLRSSDGYCSRTMHNNCSRSWFSAGVY